MRGIFNLKPALPKYGETWDVKGLEVPKITIPTRGLSPMALSQKLAMLLVLLTGHQGQSIFTLELAGMECSDSSLVVSFRQLLKTSRPCKHSANCFTGL